MKESILTLLMVFSISLSTDAQSIREWKDFLDDYCENYFKDCFDWSYIKIVGINDIDPVSEDITVIEGVVRNDGYFGAVYDRMFKATIETTDEGRIMVNFAKLGRIGGRSFWTDCKKCCSDLSPLQCSPPKECESQ